MAEDEGDIKNSEGTKGGAADPGAGSATEKPHYGQRGEPLPTGVNQTDAPGARTGYDAGAAAAARGETEEIARAREIVKRADAARGVFEGKDGRLPHVLKTNLHVRRGDQVHNIPSGTVVQDTDLTDEEWDQLLRDGLVGEATVAELRAHEARIAREESEAAAKEQRRKDVGVKPKSAKGNKAPRGSTLVADLNEGAAAGALAAAARQTIVAGSVIGAPAASAATPESIKEAREAGERARAAEEKAAEKKAKKERERAGAAAS